jgi:hypothetical protein
MVQLVEEHRIAMRPAREPHQPAVIERGQGDSSARSRVRHHQDVANGRNSFGDRPTRLFCLCVVRSRNTPLRAVDITAIRRDDLHGSRRRPKSSSRDRRSPGGIPVLKGVDYDSELARTMTKLSGAAPDRVAWTYNGGDSSCPSGGSSVQHRNCRTVVAAGLLTSRASRRRP